MINDIEKSSTISFTNGDKMGKCNGCVAKWGNSWAEADQVIYMTNERLGEFWDNFCYYCSTKLIDKIKDTVEKKYFEDLKKQKGIQ
jgi:hypothetical protein